MIRSLTGVKEETKEAAIKEVKTLLKTVKSVRMHNRYQTIHLLLMGHSPQDVSE